MLKQTLILTLLICAVVSVAVFQSAYAQVNEFKLTAFDGKTEDKFGFSVALDSDYTIVGVPGKDISGTNEGAAYIYHRSGINTWSSGAKIGPSDGQDFDSFGSSVAIDGDNSIVGSPGEDISGTSEGAAYFYHRSGTNTWGSGIKIIAPDGQSNDSFGTAVGISGDYAIIGAPSQDGSGGDMGAAYIFHRTGIATWDSGTKIMASDAQNDEFFGHAVAINGDYAIVGSGSPFSNATGKGAAYIFMRTNTNSWDAQTKLEASDGIIGDHFGESVGIDGNYVIIGTPSHDDGRGAAYIFKRTGLNSWGNSTKIVAPSNTESLDYWFGFRVGLEGDYAIISEHGDDSIGVNTGAAHIFQRTVSNNWESQIELRASDAQDDDIFGFAVDISNDNAVVGAISDDDKGLNSGSAYMYSPLIVSIDDNHPTYPKSFQLLQNYPNPFNPVTTIRYALPKRSDVSLVIYNILGEEVLRFSEPGVQAGHHEFVWDAANAASGVYLYRLRASPTSVWRAGDFVQTKKMLLLK